MRALNEPTAEPIKHHQVVHGRMKDSFTSMYQTILSIIQGVALADLAMFVVAKYPQFTVVHWLMVLTTFFMFIVVFNVYSIQSAVWDWIPDIRDESIPFVFGALELFLNHTISLNMSLWFLGLAGISYEDAVIPISKHFPARGDAGTYPSHQRCCAATASRSGETQGDASPPHSPPPPPLRGFVYNGSHIRISVGRGRDSAFDVEGA